MKQQYLKDLLEEKNIVVPLIYFKHYKELKISLEELLFLMYLKTLGTKINFNPSKMALDLGLDTKDMFKLVSNLTDKKLLVIETYKNEKGIMEENLDISLFYEKVISLISNDLEKVETVIDDNVFILIEKEFGRTLSPSEVEFIKAWANNFDNGVIIEAVKEATLNGVSSVRYIDKILYEWDRKGIKSVNDVKHFLNKKSKELKEPVEVFDYDWFEDEEE